MIGELAKLASVAAMGLEKKLVFREGQRQK